VHGLNGMLPACSQTSLVNFKIIFRVEFQNKFFKGDGHKFEPLSFWRYVNNQIKVLEGGSVD